MPRVRCAFPPRCAGLVTLVPTAGQIASVPPCGGRPNSVWRDFVLARDVEDLVLVYELLVGSVALPMPRGLRIGVLDHDPELGMEVDGACRHGVHLVAGVLERLGHVVEPSWPTVLESLWKRAFAAMVIVSDNTRPGILTWLAERLGRPVEPGEVRDEVFEGAARAQSRQPQEVQHAQQTIDAAIAPIGTWWNDHDILVTPSTFKSSWPLGGSPDVAEVGNLSAPFSFTGQPAMSVPVHDVDGLPVGVQLVGRRGDDGLLLTLARLLQEAMGWLEHRPPTFAAD